MIAAGSGEARPVIALTRGSWSSLEAFIVSSPASPAKLQSRSQAGAQASTATPQVCEHRSQFLYHETGQDVTMLV